MLSKTLKTLFSFLILLVFSCCCFATQTRSLTVMLDWFVNPDHAPIFVAQEKGFFKKHHLNVTIIPPADPSDTSKLVAIGKADIGVTYQPQFIQEVAHGFPLVQVGTLIATPLNCLVTLKRGSIKTLKNLKGKKIGYSMAGSDDVTLKLMLKSVNLSTKDVHMINVHYGLTQALLTHCIDAFIGGMRNFEPIEMEIAGKPARLFYPEDYGMPYYDELIFITNRKHLNDPRIKDFMAAIQDGVNYLINHPDKTWKTFANKHPVLNNELNQRAWNKTLSRFALRPNLIDKDRIKNYAAFLKNQKVIKKIPNVNKMVL